MDAMDLDFENEAYSNLSDNESVASSSTLYSQSSSHSQYSNKSNRPITSTSSQQPLQFTSSTSLVVKSTIQRPTVLSSRNRKNNLNSSKLETSIKRQFTGSFKQDEIGVVLSNSFRDSKLQKSILTTFLTEDENFTGLYFSEAFTNNCIRWTFRPRCFGGKGTVGEENVAVLPVVVVQFPADEFVRLASLSVTLFSYVELGRAIHETTALLTSLDGCPQDTRVIFLVVDLDQEILKHKQVKTIIVFIVYYYRNV
jgi:hypothetical protein